MKRRYILSFAIAFSLALAGTASAGLWSWFDLQGMDLPPVEERATLAVSCGIVDYEWQYRGTDIQNPLLEECLDKAVNGTFNNTSEFLVELCDGILCDELLGGNQARRPTEFKSSLDENKLEGHSDTTIRLTTITTKDGNTLSGDILGSRIVLSINPGRSNSETVLCTGLTVSTKTFTGCTFGFRFDDPLATQASNIKPHSPGEPVIISNTDTFNVDNFISRTGTQIITATNTWSGIQTYTVFPEFTDGTTPTTTNQFATKGYIDGVAIAGGVNADETTKGISELATRIEMASSTPFDVNNPHVIQSQYATSTCEFTGLNVVITENDGKISTGCIDQSSAYTWTATTTMTTTTMDEATITSSTITTLRSEIVTTTVLDAGTLCLGGANCVTSIPSGSFVSSTSQNISITNNTETNIINTSIAGGILGTDECIFAEGNITHFNNDSAIDLWTFDLQYGATTLATITHNTAQSTITGDFTAKLCGDGATNKQFGELVVRLYTDNNLDTVDGNVTREIVFGTATIDSTSAQDFKITSDWDAIAGTTRVDFRNAYVWKSTK